MKHGWYLFLRFSSANMGLVPERPINANPGLQFCCTFCIYLPMHCLELQFVLSLLFLRVKTQQYFESSSYMFSDKKTLLKIWLNLGVILSSFKEPGPVEKLSIKRIQQHLALVGPTKLQGLKK